jgi:DNA repair protein RadD
MRVIGMTATPWRLGHGDITQGDALFDELIEPTSIEELIAKGHLMPLRSKLTDQQFDLSKVHKRGGDYIESELAEAVDSIDKNLAIAREIVARADGRRHWLLHCTGIMHAAHMRDALMTYGVPADVVTGELPKAKRADILRAFRSGELRAICQVNTLSVGFDFPDIDLMAFLRPTESPRLYMQQAGRGLRPKSHTNHCLVLDFAGNVSRHGPITAVRSPDAKSGKKGEGEVPVKPCPECAELCALVARTCPACGYAFPEPEKAELKLHRDDIMGREATTMLLESWQWSEHTSKTSGLKMLRVDYYSADMSDPRISEYLTVLHDGFAGAKALRNLHAMAKDAGVFLVPGDTLEKTCERMNRASAPSSIQYAKDGKYFRVTSRKWEPREVEEIADDEIPF